MASASKKTGKSTVSRSGNTRRRSPAGNTASRSRSKKVVPKTPLLTVLKDNSGGRFVLILITVVCILGLDFLISLNQFDRFFLFLGIELIAAVLIGWIRFVLRGRNDEDN